MTKRRWAPMAVGIMCAMLMLVIAVSAPVLAAPPEVIEITVNDHNPEPSSLSQAVAYWAKKVNESGQGKIKMTVHYGGELLMGSEEYRGVQKGVVDASVYVLDRRDGLLLNTVMQLPFMGWPDQEKAGQIYVQLMNKFPQMKSEFKGVIPYAFCMMPPTHIHNNKRVIRTPLDLKGLTIHSAEYGLIPVLEVAGATAVQLDITDMATALEMGVVDGVLNHFPVLLVFRALPFLPFHTVFGKGGVNMTQMGIIWNEKKWNSYPPDVKKILTDAAHFYTEKFSGINAEVQAALGFAKENNHTFTELTPQEIKVWYDLVKKPIHDKWIAEAEAKGLAGRAVYNEALRLIQKQQ